MQETLKEVQIWLDDKNSTDNQKIESIASMLFVELSDEQKIELFEESGDDFDFYIKAIKSIDYDFYDGDCIREMCETILDEFIAMNTMPSERMKQQYKLLSFR